MVLSVTRLSYKEDIRDFLPLDEEERAALNDYDSQARTSLIVAIIEATDSTTDDPDLLVEGVETFLDAIGDMKDLTVQTDFSQMEEQQEEMYRQLPYLLEEADYQRMDSLVQPEVMASRLQEARERLLMPMMGSMVADEITRDPLGLFSPVVSLMRDTAALSRFDIYDGCLLTADHRRALVMLNSPYGGSETSSNEQLLEQLQSKADSTLSTLHLQPSTDHPLLRSSSHRRHQCLADQDRLPVIRLLGISTDTLTALVLPAQFEAYSADSLDDRLGVGLRHRLSVVGASGGVCHCYRHLVDYCGYRC